MTLKARVRAGRLIVDEPTDLPEGTEVELIPQRTRVGVAPGGIDRQRLAADPIEHRGDRSVDRAEGGGRLDRIGGPDRGLARQVGRC